MSRERITLSICILLAALCGGVSAAADNAGSFIQVVGRPSATVSTPAVRLGDIAAVSSPLVTDDESVIALQKIVVGAAPEPGRNIAIAGEQILNKLTEAKVDLQKIRYSFPQMVQIERAARELTESELRAAVEGYLAAQQRDAVVKGIDLRAAVLVAPGAITLEVLSLTPNTNSREIALVSARVSGESEQRIRVPVQLEEWRSVPVAVRSLGKGEIVSSSDVVMARLSSNAIPRDSLEVPNSIFGLALSAPIRPGEVFLRGKLALPTVIAAGSRVTLLYRSPLFEATASGMALENGADGQEISVRNEGSKKIVTGVVIDPGLVMVKGGQ